VLKTCAGKMNKTLKGFSPAARELFLPLFIPQDVRELENMVERAVHWGADRETIQHVHLCGFQSLSLYGGQPQDRADL